MKDALKEAYTAGKRAARPRTPKAIAQTQTQKLQKIISELLEALQDLLDFAELYGISTRATYEDWSGYFEAARATITRAENISQEGQ